MTHILARLALSVSLSGLASAQTLSLLSGDPNDPFVRSEQRDGLAAGTWAGILAGDLTGNVAKDVLVWTTNGSNRLLAAPGVHRTEMPLPNLPAVQTAALVKGFGPLLLDAVVFTNASGLHLWRFDPTTGNGLVTSLPDPLWAGARLATHPNRNDVVFGLDTTPGNEFLRFASIGPTGGLANVHSLRIRGTPRDIACVDPGSGLLVLVASNVDVAAYDETGGDFGTAALTPLGGTPSQVSIAPVQSNGVDQFVVLRSTTSGSPACALDTGYFDLTRPFGQQTWSQPVDLFGNQFTAVSSGDMTGDGYDEIMLSRAANDEVTLLLNLSYGPGLSSFLHAPFAGLRIAVAATSGAPTNVLGACIVDLDNDADGDFVVPRHSSTSAGVQFSTNLLFPNTPICGFGGAVLTQQNPQANTVQYRLSFTPPSYPCHVQVVGWKSVTPPPSPVPPGFVPEMLPVPAVHAIYGSNPATGAVGSVLVDLEYDHLKVNHGAYFFMVRPILLPLTPTSVSNPPSPWIAAASAAEIGTLTDSHNGWVTYNPTIATSVRIPGIVPRARLPRAPAGLPTPRRTQVGTGSSGT